jgi:hypothetical protein
MDYLNIDQNLTADKMRELSSKALAEKAEAQKKENIKELNAILQSIKLAANNGLTEYAYKYALNVDVCTALQGLGYSIKTLNYKDMRGSVTNVISW